VDGIKFSYLRCDILYFMSEFEAKIKSIYIAPEQGAPMQKVSQVKAIEGFGLEGDRYAEGKGFWQNVKNPRSVRRDVSLILASDIEGTGFPEEETRRNIIVDGNIDLLNLVGREFFVGEVRMRGEEDCTPCKRPSQLSGREGFEKLFKGEEGKSKGGIRAQVLSSGTIYEGSALRIIDNE